MPFGENDIKFDRGIAASRSLRADDVSDTGSTESQQAIVKEGGITRQTEVNIIGAPSVKESDEDMAGTT
jgi:hypothetical protein